jgi:hypothetical protein
VSTGRLLMGAGALFRIVYGLGAIAAPDAMSRFWAPDIRGHPAGRMNLRGFGGAQLGIGSFTAYAVAVEPRLARPAIGLNLATDAFDSAVSALEWHDRGRADRVVVGGVVLNVVGLALGAAALRSL